MRNTADGLHFLDSRTRSREPDVFGNHAVEHEVVLQHDAQLRAIVAEPHAREIAAIDEHAALLRPVEGHHEADERALARSARPDQRRRRSGGGTNETCFSTGTPAAYSNDTSSNTTSPFNASSGWREASSSSSVAIALISRIRSRPASASDSCVPIDDIWMSGAASMPTKKMYDEIAKRHGAGEDGPPPTTIITTPIAPMTMPPNEVTAEICPSASCGRSQTIQHARGEHAVLALLGDVCLDDANAAERLGQAA